MTSFDLHEPARTATHASPVDPERVRILVVDDVEDNRYTLGMFLDLEGYTNVEMAADGAAAVAAIAAASFDLVLLDVMMPVMNGIEVLERLQVDGRLHRLPVIMISAQQELDSVVRCIELGAEDYLPKPFNQTLLAARIRASLEKKILRERALAELHRMEGELRAARELQLSMVPRAKPLAVAVPGLEVAAVLAPARELGGDFYDCFRVADGAWCLVVGDVCDKGVAAALFMARAMNAIRLMATRADAGLDPSGWLAAANEELCGNNRSRMFVALTCAVIQADTGAVRLINAGGVDPWCVSRDGLVTRIEVAKSRPLGVRSGQSYVVRQLALDRGDRLVLCTDGIPEAMNAEGALYGETRLAAALDGVVGDAASVLSAIVASSDAFRGDAEAADDIAVLVASH